jgi:glucokinase
MAKVREHTVLREEQAALAAFAVVPDLDMAGARGAALAAHVSLQSTSINLIHQ